MKLKSIVSYVVLGVTNSDGVLIEDTNLGLVVKNKNGALIGLQFKCEKPTLLGVG